MSLWLISQSFAPELPEDVHLIQAESLESACRAFAEAVQGFQWSREVCVVNAAGQRRAVLVGRKWVDRPQRLFRVETVGWQPQRTPAVDSGEIVAPRAWEAVFKLHMWSNRDGDYSPDRVCRVVDSETLEVTYWSGRVWSEWFNNITPCDESGSRLDVDVLDF
jgi:hypothetical protein